jgi:hypothetical protein
MRNELLQFWHALRSLTTSRLEPKMLWPLEKSVQPINLKLKKKYGPCAHRTRTKVGKPATDAARILAGPSRIALQRENPNGIRPALKPTASRWSRCSGIARSSLSQRSYLYSENMGQGPAGAPGPSWADGNLSTCSWDQKSNLCTTSKNTPDSMKKITDMMCKSIKGDLACNIAGINCIQNPNNNQMDCIPVLHTPPLP